MSASDDHKAWCPPFSPRQSKKAEKKRKDENV